MLLRCEYLRPETLRGRCRLDMGLQEADWGNCAAGLSKRPDGQPGRCDCPSVVQLGCFATMHITAPSNRYSKAASRSCLSLLLLSGAQLRLLKAFVDKIFCLPPMANLRHVILDRHHASGNIPRVLSKATVLRPCCSRACKKRIAD